MVSFSIQTKERTTENFCGIEELLGGTHHKLVSGGEAGLEGLQLTLQVFYLLLPAQQVHIKN
jgi:hypothetical protein